MIDGGGVVSAVNIAEVVTQQLERGLSEAAIRAELATLALEIVPFDEAAARQFDDLRRQKLRIGSRDLKIAATALVNDALLLSANRTDFERVPGLRVENWLD